MTAVLAALGSAQMSSAIFQPGDCDLIVKELSRTGLFATAEEAKLQLWQT